MGQTVVGFFKDISDVQKAVRLLESKGISNQHVDISKGKHLDSTADRDGRNTNKITDFFNKLFGHESDDARLYSTIGQQDFHILTVHADSGEMAEKAADILDNCGALDVDEQRRGSTAGGRKSSNSAVTDKNKSGKQDESRLRRDSSRSSNDALPGADKSLSYRDDYANTLSGENPARDINEPTNPNDDTISLRGPGMYDSNSDYIDERSYPGDRTGSSDDDRTDWSDTDVTMRNPVEETGNRERNVGDMGAGSNDGFSTSGSRSARLNNESGTRGRGASFTGEDMTNDGISSPSDDQRTINQTNAAHEGQNQISDEEAPGLETNIPSPDEQLYRAKRRSRIINATVENNNRLRD